MLAIPSDIRLKDAALQPGARLRLEDDRFGHDDLLSGRKTQKEIRIMCRSIALRGSSRRPSWRIAHNFQRHIITAMHTCGRRLRLLGMVTSAPLAAALLAVVLSAIIAGVDGLA
jgi:hypothetical protein